jgi:hypothetical protein
VTEPGKSTPVLFYKRSEAYLLFGLLAPIIGFLFLEYYIPEEGLIYNVLNKDVVIQGVHIPYNFVLALSVIALAYGWHLRKNEILEKAQSTADKKIW